MTKPRTYQNRRRYLLSPIVFMMAFCMILIATTEAFFSFTLPGTSRSYDHQRLCQYNQSRKNQLLLLIPSSLSQIDRHDNDNDNDSCTRKHSVVVFASTADRKPHQHDNSIHTPSDEHLTTSTTAAIIPITLWFVSLSYFIVRNYTSGPWIPFFSSVVSKRGWVFLHALSNTFFAGGIILSTIMEWYIIRSASSSSSSNMKSPEIIKYWFLGINSRIDKGIVLPALTCSIVAGFAQAALDYGSMMQAPVHIRSAVHILATFALWWLITDLPTQSRARTAIVKWYQQRSTAAAAAAAADSGKNDDSSSLLSSLELPRVLYWRRWSNIVSCLFVVSLYAIMSLKPGYPAP